MRTCTTTRPTGPGLLSAQLCSPVRWRQTLETFAGLGLTSLVELGPGGVLSGLAKRSLPEIQSLAVSKPEDLDTLMDQIGAAGTWRAEPALHQGEHLYMSERVVVSPSSGIFSPEVLPAGARDRAPARDAPATPTILRRRRRRAGRPGRRLRGPHALRGAGHPLAGRRRRAGPGGPAPRLAPGARHPLMAVVLVTGGTRGIGAACVDVVPGQRRPGRHDLPLGRPARRHPRVRMPTASWPCAATCATATRSSRPSPPIEEHWGPVEVLVANAGITMDSLMLRMSEQAFHDVIDANLTGSFRVAKRAVAKMLRLHTGRIIFVSSVGAFVGLPGRPTTPRRRPASSAWPGPSPGRWAAARSP